MSRPLKQWWTNSTLQHFQEKSQCFIDQYGNFTVKDPQGRENHVNGKLTLGENLADNGGYVLSEKSYVVMLLCCYAMKSATDTFNLLSSILFEG